MRVLHVVCTDAFAGVERHVAQLAAVEQEKGHDVEVIGGDPRLMTSAIGHPRVRHSAVATVLDAARWLNANPDHDVVNVHMTAAEAAAALAPRARRVPVVATRHFAQRRGSRVLTRPLAKVVARHIRAQISVSHFIASRIDGPSTVVHSGVLTAASAVPAAERTPAILVAQRLEPEKRTHVALEAFAASRVAGTGWRLLLAGEGSLRPVLERQARALGVAEQVDFLGHRPDVGELMTTAGIFLAPRPDEGYGLSVLEAMAAGLPVVAAAGGGHLETVGSVAGAALFGPGDVEEAARHLSRLAADPSARDQYGRALQEAQRTDFTLRAQQAATEAVYRSVL